MPKSPIFVMRVNVERWRAASVDAPAQGVIIGNFYRASPLQAVLWGTSLERHRYKVL